MTKSEAIFELETIKFNLVGEYAAEVSDKRAEYIKRKIDAVDLAVDFMNGQWLGGSKHLDASEVNEK